MSQQDSRIFTRHTLRANSSRRIHSSPLEAPRPHLQQILHAWQQNVVERTPTLGKNSVPSLRPDFLAQVWQQLSLSATAPQRVPAERRCAAHNCSSARNASGWRTQSSKTALYKLPLMCNCQEQKNARENNVVEIRGRQTPELVGNSSACIARG